MKTTLTELIEKLQELKSDIISDLKSSWITEDEKLDLQSDLNLLRQSLSHLCELKENASLLFFNNIEK